MAQRAEMGVVMSLWTMTIATRFCPSQRGFASGSIGWFGVIA